MYDWVHIISHQWYRTLSAHEITQFCCELNKLQEVNYVISSSWSHIQRIYVLLNKVGSLARKCYWYEKKLSSLLYYYAHSLIYHDLPRDQHIKHTCVSKNRFSFHKTVFFYLRLNPYISNISNLYNPDQNLSLAYQTICDHVFS